MPVPQGWVKLDINGWSAEICITYQMVGGPPPLPCLPLLISTNNLTVQLNLNNGHAKFGAHLK